VTSLAATLHKLARFPSGSRLNVSQVAQFVGMDRPVSMAALMARIDALPDSVPFHSTIVTGAALGGQVTVILNKDGSYRFSGSMRATGFPSFAFRVGAVIRNDANAVVLAAQHSGKVFGTDTPGDRQNNWDEVGTDERTMLAIRNLWPDIIGSSMVVNHSSDLAGTLGVAADIVKDIAELFVVAEIGGVQLAVCLILGSELQQAGLTMPGLGGVVGLTIVAGSVVIFGPQSLVQAMVVGVALGALTDELLVKVRTLSRDEIAFATQVFGDSLDYGRIRLTNLVGLSNRAFTIPAVDGNILLNVGLSNAFDDPVHAVIPGSRYMVPGQLFIHELVHAWQYQHASIDDGFAPGQLCQGIVDQTKGSTAYNYGPPGTPWGCFGMEAQAAIVDEWFGGTGHQVTKADPSGMDRDSPYFGYIVNDLRLGEKLG
jgi:hypothetical protein